jgi:hypothetical protein
MQGNQAKEQLLRESGYVYLFDRMAFVNTRVRKVFSLEAVEDNTEGWLRERIAEAPNSPGWNFYFNEEPSDSVKRKFLENIE